MVTPEGIKSLAAARDVNLAQGAGTDGYSITWDNATSKFVLTEVAGVTDHGGLSGLGDDDHTQYLLATGARIGATSQAQVFTNGVTSTGTLIVGQNIRPNADSTTAIQIQNAAGTVDVISLDTTNTRVGINGAGQAGTVLTLRQPSHNTGLRIYGYDTQSAQYFGLSVNAGGAAAMSSTSLMVFAHGGQLTFSATSDTNVIFNGASGDRTVTMLHAQNSMGIGANHTPTAYVDIKGSTSSRSSMRLRTGADPTSPNDGDIWQDGTDLKVRISGTTYTLNKTSV